MENLTREFDAFNSRGSCVGELSFVRVQNVVAACDMCPVSATVRQVEVFH